MAKTSSILIERFPSEYGSWKALRSRCADRSNPRYGGRGIQVSARWLGPDGFSNFLADMGPKPDPSFSIDRIDNDGDYEPSNCRWLDAHGQARNTSRTILIEHDGETLCLEDLARRYELNWTTLWSRLTVHGWSLQKALESPEKNAGNKVNHGTPRRKARLWDGVRERLEALRVTSDDALYIFSCRALVPSWALRQWLHEGHYRTLRGRRWDTFSQLQIDRILRAVELQERERAQQEGEHHAAA